MYISQHDYPIHDDYRASPAVRRRTGAERVASLWRRSRSGSESTEVELPDKVRVRRAMGARTSTQSYRPRTSPHESQALPSLLDATPSARPASVCHTCLCSAHGRCCLPFACPLPALLGGAHFPPARPRAPDGCPCTLTRSARCPNPSLPVCRRCGSLTATIIGARCDAHATPHYGSSSDKSGGSYG